MSASCCVPRARLPNGDALNAHGPEVPSRMGLAAGKHRRCRPARRCRFARPPRSRARSSRTSASDIQAKGKNPRGCEPSQRADGEGDRRDVQMLLQILIEGRSGIETSTAHHMTAGTVRRISLNPNTRPQASRAICGTSTARRNSGHQRAKCGA